jgi:hypothetical protein
MRDTLLAQAVSLLSETAAAVAGPHSSEMPTGDLTQVNLGKPPESLKDARARLKALEADEKAELISQRDALITEAEAEEKIAAAGVYDIKEELANGATRESLANRRASAEVASEIAQLKRGEIADVTEQINDIHRAWGRKTERLMQWVSQVEVNTRAWAIALIRGGNDHKLSPSNTERAFYQILELDKHAREILDDDELVDRLMDDITRLEMPLTDRGVTQQGVLWTLMTPKGRDRFKNDNPFTDDNSKEQ